MSKEYNHEIGYETLQADFKIYKKQTPRGITLVKGGNNIYLQFRTPNKSRSKYPCNCTFSIDGMIDAVRKASKVKERLENLTSEVEFWEWYDKEIKNESQLVDDRITFKEAIKKVEDDFWTRLSRTKRKRDKSNPSDLNSWDKTYGTFYRHLPLKNTFNLTDVQKAVDKYAKGARTYKYVVSAMKKLAGMNKQTKVYDYLHELDVTQTIFTDLQSTTLEDFMKWRLRTLGITASLHKNASLEAREAWMWVFSTQVVYALRISEVFAIKNLFEPFLTKDGVTIPALNDPTNVNNLIYIGDYTNLGTTVKTGSRIARPQIPPKYPNLIEDLGIKQPVVPTNRPKGDNPKSIRNFHCATARRKLVQWDAPFTQTHADRHLGNINGIQAGIPQEVRAQSLGHSVQMNESVYKKRQSTQTTIDLLLNSNQNAIDFVTALAEAKKLVKDNESDKLVIAKLLSIIYQKRQDELIELL